jgi:dethiobiotin synthetase
MVDKPCHGLFVTGTGTGVGKTYVASLIARSLVAGGRRVGVYKPAASGCRREGDQLVADDAMALWHAAGRPATLGDVCPQRFQAPLAPHLAARAEGKELDRALLRSGITRWSGRAEIVIVEGAGGLMSPLSDEDYVADLAYEFGYPLVVVAPNTLGVINHTLQTLMAAAGYRGGLGVAGIVLNDVPSNRHDPSRWTNRAELARHVTVPILAQVGWQDEGLDPATDWYALAVGDCAQPKRPQCTRREKT